MCTDAFIFRLAQFVYQISRNSVLNIVWPNTSPIFLDEWSLFPRADRRCWMPSLAKYREDFQRAPAVCDRRQG